MKRITNLILCFFLSISVCGQSGYGSLKGKLTDKNSNEPLPFVNVVLKQEGKQVDGGVTDFDGKYYIKPLKPGKYDLEVSSVGYKSKQVKGIIISPDKITFQDISLEQGVQLEEVEIVRYQVPLIYKDGGSSGATISHESISALPTRSISGIANTVGGVKIRGSRSNSTNYYVNGIKVSGQQNREQYNAISYQPFFEVSDEPLSTFSIDVDRASYSIVRRYLQDGMLPPKDAVRIEEMVNYFTYDYPNPEGPHPFSIKTEYTNCPWNKKHTLLHIGIQGKKIEHKETAPNNLVFLIDVSGSMTSNDKLPLLKSGFNMLVDQLRPQDKVAIVVYAGAAGVVLEPTSGDEKSKIKSTIGELQAGGSTAGGEGIRLAYKLAKQHFIEGGNNRVILATDGDFNVGVSSQDGLINLIEEKREDNIFLSVLGFGSGNLQDGKMEQLADKGNGNYSYIDNVLEAKKVLVSEFQSTLITIAKDVKTQIEFNPQLVRAYRMVGYVNRQLESKDFNDDTKDAGELGAGHTVTMIYELVLAGSNEILTGDIDALKYQTSKNKNKSRLVVGYNDEIATIKLRYKAPEAHKSQLLSKVIYSSLTPWEEVSRNCQFSSAVAQFGMLLRNSNYLDETDYESIIKQANAAKGKDDYGYRSEFVKLVETAMLLADHE